MKISLLLGVFLLAILANDKGVLGAPLTKSELEITTDGTVEEKGKEKEGEEDEEDEALNYLKKYGYTKPGITKNSADFEDEHKKALKRLQKFYNLDITGELDNKTKEILKSPRCALPDITIDQSGQQKRYDISSRLKWGFTSLTYYVQNKPSSSTGFTSDDDLYATVDESLKMWSEYSTLKFTKSQSSNANLRVAFYRYDHGDGSPFDGPGKELAHAFYPTDGRIHMDDSERWSKTDNDYNVKQVLTHEAGHALGLGHSNDPAAVMYPTYRNYLKNFKLGSDDIAGIQKLYGSNGVNQPTTTTARPWSWSWFWNYFRRY